MAGTLRNESNWVQFLGVLELQPMATDDFFRARLDTMIDLRHPLAVLAWQLLLSSKGSGNNKSL